MHPKAAFEPQCEHGETLDSLSGLLEVVGSHVSLHAQLEELVLYVERLSRDTRCSILLYDPISGTLHCGAGPHVAAAFIAATDGVAIGEGVGSCGTAAARRATVVVANTQTSPLWREYRHLASAHGLAACWSTPVIDDRGELLGTFAMYYSEPREPSDAELDVLRIAGPLAAVVIQRHRDALCLRESEQRFVSVFENAAIGMALVGVDGRWLRVNRAICQIVGYSAEDLLQLELRSLIHPADLGMSQQFRQEMLDGKRVRFDLEKRYVHKLGHIIWVQLSVSLVRDERGAPMYFIMQIQDISERRKLEQSLGEWMSSEQQRIGRDLHDGLGQELTGLSLLASAFANSAERLGSPLVAEARALARLATSAVVSCRDIVRGVSPLTESNGVLGECLQRLAASVSDLHGCNVTFQSDNTAMNLSWYTRNQLFRIAQEALNNALQHSSASKVRVSLEVESLLVRLRITDDGMGLAPVTAQHGGSGIATMRFRANAIHARLFVEVNPSGGTIVRCECPHPAANKLSWVG